MEFKKWFEKENFDAFQNNGDFYELVENVVSSSALGEWAWQTIKERLEKDKKNINVDHYHKRYWEIAVACLGEKEIENRLKEVNVMGIKEFKEDLKKATNENEKEVDKCGAELRKGMQFDKI